VCRAKDAEQYMNDRNGARFQRSQSQNDLDRPAHDDRFYSPTDLRSSASGYDFQQRDADQALRRHPSDVGDRYRRSYDDWNGTRMPLSVLDSNNVPRIDAAVQMDQKYQPPSDTSKNWESSRKGDPRDAGYQRDYDGRLAYSEGDELRPSRENVATVAAGNKRLSVRNDNPKNQDIINWLQRGDDRDSAPHDSGYSPDRTDLDHSAKTSGPQADRENMAYPQFRVSNPMYDEGRHASVGEHTQSSDGSIKDKDVASRQHGYNWSDARGHSSFTNNSRWPNNEHSQQGSHVQARGMGHELALSGNQRDGSSQMLPPKPVHTAMSNSLAAYRFDQSEDLPPSLPPKLANQQAPLKPPHVIPGQLDQYQRSAEAPPTSQAGDHLLRGMKADSGNQMDLTPEYAIVRKRTAQSVVPDQAVGDFGRRSEVERWRADGSGYQPDMASRSRQSLDGMLDSPPTGKSNSAVWPLVVGVTSSGDSGKERRPATKSSSREDLISTPSVRSPVSSDNTPSGVPENFSGSRRSEPQGGVEHIDPQVNMFFDMQYVICITCIRVRMAWKLADFR